MSARLVDIIVTDADVAEARALIARHCRRFWQEAVPGGREKFSCIVQSRYVERLLDELDTRFGAMADFSATVLELEAVLPPLEENFETAMPDVADLAPPTRLEAFFSRDRISTDELYDDIEESLVIRPSFLLTVVLSAIIAALGMRSGQTAVVIGAMVIAPLLGPTMGMALGATVGNRQLLWRAFETLAAGTVAALLATIAVGYFISVDPAVPELHNRAIVQPADIALALACGAAGVLAFSRGSSLALVGVMIAVALVPPLAAAGLFFSKGYGVLGLNALFLFATNLVCVNLSGIAMFLFQGLPPKNWRMTWGIMAIWAVILLLFFGFMVGRLAFGVGSMELVDGLVALLGGR
ncbi:TIGR00341 family protein [Parasphingopyxis marina]|uniref:TIGR00341 family protein n=1 Tax=Parasphingopyxis marina TaxID=2761622 RepID=A0A842I1E1_9SPHN|nr:TIGR00341 family protein [Parasphingopyxis marina]MBC2778489.1 TIGR00341 family protein [Parasphingopyxis marina]